MEDMEGVRGEDPGGDAIVIATELPSEIAEQLDWIGRQREAANLKLGEACEDLVQAKQAVHDAERLLSDLAHDERLIRRTVEICLRSASSSPATADVATMQGQNKPAAAPVPAAAPPRRRRSPTEIRLEVFGALSILNGVPQRLSVRTLMDITSAAKSTVESALAHYQKLGQVEEVSPGTWRKRLPDPEGAASAPAANSLASQTPEAGSPEDRLKTDAEIIDFARSCGSVGASETQMSLVGASPAQIDRLVENGDLLWSSDDHFYRVPELVVTDEAAS